MRSRPMTKPFDDTRVTAFFAGYGISALGSGMALLMLPVLMLRATGSPSLVAIVASIEATPLLLFGLLAGSLADRGNLSRLLIASDTFAGAVFCVASLIAVTGHLDGWGIAACAALSAIPTVFRDAAM